MFKGEEPPVIELLEVEPPESGMANRTEEETLFVCEDQGQDSNYTIKPLDSTMHVDQSLYFDNCIHVYYLYHLIIATIPMSYISHIISHIGLSYRPFFIFHKTLHESHK